MLRQPTLVSDDGRPNLRHIRSVPTGSASLRPDPRHDPARPQREPSTIPAVARAHRSGAAATAGPRPWWTTVAPTAPEARKSRPLEHQRAGMARPGRAPTPFVAAVIPTPRGPWTAIALFVPTFGGYRLALLPVHVNPFGGARKLSQSHPIRKPPRPGGRPSGLRQRSERPASGLETAPGWKPPEAHVVLHATRENARHKNDTGRATPGRDSACSWTPRKRHRSADKPPIRSGLRTSPSASPCPPSGP